jgi:hypothetical protein
LAWLVVPQKIDPVITIYEIASSFSSLPWTVYIVFPKLAAGED